MSPNQILAPCALKNGLVMTCTDQSRKIAADRWFVSVGIEIKIPVLREWFADEKMDDALFERMVETLGDEVVFRQKKERNFVSQKDKEQVVDQIYVSACSIGQNYCGRREFAERFIRKTFIEKQQRR